MPLRSAATTAKSVLGPRRRLSALDVTNAVHGSRVGVGATVWPGRAVGVIVGIVVGVLVAVGVLVGVSVGPAVGVGVLSSTVRRKSHSSVVNSSSASGFHAITSTAGWSIHSASVGSVTVVEKTPSAPTAVCA